MAIIFSDNSEDNNKFECKECYYVCYKKQHYKQHCNTIKHKNKNNNTLVTDNKCVKCGKQYMNRTGLWRHKMKCSSSNIVGEPDILTEVIKCNNKLQKQNNELQKQILEIYKNSNTSTIINQTTNNNQKFNINVFLNETCKDAINFSDFIKNIQISYEDLENNAQLGFVGGISKIFSDNLKQIGINERPIHCTDVKRETIYIKDENVWTKQQDDDKLQKAIQTVSYRSMGKLAEWKQENPDYKDCNSEFSQKCLDIHRHTLAGSDRQVYYPKVIHALARETIIENKGGHLVL